MPVYLLHGFRWPRAGFTGIRVHAILHKLEDISVEYIQNEHSTTELLSSFRKAFPDIMKELEGPGKGLTFLEQYDPDDETSDSAVSQPYAFVGDRVVTIAGGVKTMATAALKRPDTGSSKGPLSGERMSSGDSDQAQAAVAASRGPTLSLNVEEVVTEGPGFTPQAWEALAELRDKVAEKEKIGWWVVYNGDPERGYDDEENLNEDHDGGEDISEQDEDTEEEAKSATTRSEKTTPLVPSSEKTVRPTRSPPPNIPPPPIKDIVPPPIMMPIRDIGKPLPVKPPSAEVEKPDPPLPPVPKLKSSKSEGFKKKFFGRKG